MKSIKPGKLIGYFAITVLVIGAFYFTPAAYAQSSIPSWPKVIVGGTTYIIPPLKTDGVSTGLSSITDLVVDEAGNPFSGSAEQLADIVAAAQMLGSRVENISSFREVLQDAKLSSNIGGSISVAGDAIVQASGALMKVNTGGGAKKINAEDIKSWSLSAASTLTNINVRAQGVATGAVFMDVAIDALNKLENFQNTIDQGGVLSISDLKQMYALSENARILGVLGAEVATVAATNGSETFIDIAKRQITGFTSNFCNAKCPNLSELSTAMSLGGSISIAAIIGTIENDGLKQLGSEIAPPFEDSTLIAKLVTEAIGQGFQTNQEIRASSLEKAKQEALVKAEEAKQLEDAAKAKAEDAKDKIISEGDRVTEVLKGVNDEIAKRQAEEARRANELAAVSNTREGAKNQRDYWSDQVRKLENDVKVYKSAYNSALKKWEQAEAYTAQQKKLDPNGQWYQKAVQDEQKAKDLALGYANKANAYSQDLSSAKKKEQTSITNYNNVNSALKRAEKAKIDAAQAVRDEEARLAALEQQAQEAAARLELEAQQAAEDALKAGNDAQAARDSLKAAEEAIVQVINDNTQPPPATPPSDKKVVDNNAPIDFGFDSIDQEGLLPVPAPVIGDRIPATVMPVIAINPNDQNVAIGPKKTVGYYMPSNPIAGSLTLLGEYRFENNANNSATGGSALGNGVAIGAPTYVTGVKGKAIHVFGDAADSAANAIKIAAANSFVPGNNGFIVDGYIKLDTVNNTAAFTTLPIVNVQGWDFGEAASLRVQTSSGGFIGQAGMALSGGLPNSGDEQTTFSGTGDFANGAWYHVRYIVDRLSKKIRVIVDGKEVLNTALTVTGSIDPTRDMLIGAYDYITARNGYAAVVSTNGYFDDLKITQGQFGNVEPLIVKVDNGTASTADSSFMKAWDGKFSGQDVYLYSGPVSGRSSMNDRPYIQLNDTRNGISSASMHGHSVSIVSSYYNGKNDFGFTGKSDSGSGFSVDTWGMTSSDPDLMQYDYTTWGVWQRSDSANSKGISDMNPASSWIMGRVTPDNDIPSSGTATYVGKVSGIVENAGVVSGLNGNLNLTANFGTRQLSGTFNNMKKDDGTAWTDLTVQASWSTANNPVNNIGGSVSGGGKSGMISGSFNGPAASELGGNWNATGGGDTAVGIFRGQKQ